MKVLSPGSPIGAQAEPGLGQFAGTVGALPLISVDSPATAGIALVEFVDGARTHWHRHAGGQVIHVISGIGAIQVRDEPAVVLEPGSTIIAEPSEEHWHGAASHHTSRHLSYWVGDEQWYEPAPTGA